MRNLFARVVGEMERQDLEQAASLWIRWMHSPLRPWRDNSCTAARRALYQVSSKLQAACVGVDVDRVRILS